MPILIGSIIVLIIFVIILYNSLQTARNNVKNAWSQIDIQLQRRFDLIPNLLDSVKGYMEHEEALLTRVTELRTAWSTSQTISEKAKLNKELTDSFGTIIAISENYPMLRANENFLNLQNELKNIEDKIAISRSEYNDVVTKYNIKLDTVPTNIIAKVCGFKEEELYKIDNPEIRNNVKVSF